MKCTAFTTVCRFTVVSSHLRKYGVKEFYWDPKTDNFVQENGNKFSPRTRKIIALQDLLIPTCLNSVSNQHNPIGVNRGVNFGSEAQSSTLYLCSTQTDTHYYYY